MSGNFKIPLTRPIIYALFSQFLLAAPNTAGQFILQYFTMEQNLVLHLCTQYCFRPTGVANKEVSQGKLFILSGKVRENEFCKVVGTLIFGGDKLITYWYFHQPKIWGGDAPLFLWINARGSGYSRRLRILCLSSSDVSDGYAVVVRAALDLAIRESSHQL